MVLMTADGVELPNPSKYDLTYKDLDSDNAFTSETGILNRDMIRANQVNISTSWDSLTQSQLKTIMQAISGKESFSLAYWDYYDMEFKTGTFYAQDRSISGIRVKQTGGRYSISFIITEF